MDRELLIKQMRFEYKNAQSLTQWQLYLSLIISIPAISSIFVDDKNWNYVFAVANLLVVAVWVVVRHLHKRANSAAKTARRAAMVVNALGKNLSSDRVARLQKLLVLNPPEVEFLDVKEYYSSTSALGNLRLVEIVEQSAFYSEHTHRYSWKLLISIVLIFTVLSFITLLALIPFAAKDSLMIAVRFFLASTLFFLSSDVLGRALMHKDCMHECEAIHEMCLIEINSKSHSSSTSAFMLLLDYVSAVEAAPETLAIAYNEHSKNKIDALWRDRTKNRS